MTLEHLFSIAGTLVLPGWLLLAFLPRWRWSAQLIAPVVIPALLGSLYVVLVLLHLRGTDGGFGSLAEVAKLFQDPPVLLAGWVHYLAFDLFVGSWEVRDAQRLGIHHGLVLPCLVLTFLLGPAGLLLYLAVRATKRRYRIDAAPA